MNGKYLILSVLTSIVIAGGVVGVVNAVGKPTHTRLVKEGNVVTKYVDEPTTVTDADIKEAVKVVEDWNKAIYEKDYSKQFSLLYDTFLVPFPKDGVNKWVEQQIEANKKMDSTPVQYVISGTPYAVHDWGTQSFNFMPDQKMLAALHVTPPANEQESDTNYIYKYHMVFKVAIAVPMAVKGLDHTISTNIICVQNENKQWRIAYSHAFGLERDRPVSE